MTSISATATDMLEQARRLAGNPEPPRLARLAILSYVQFLQKRNGWANDLPDSVAGAMARHAGVAQLAEQPDGIGRLWQAMNQPGLQRAFAAAGKGRRKFSSAEISAVTQLFTPAFVVDFLLEKTLGQTWRERHPDTRLARPPNNQKMQSLTPSPGTPDSGELSRVGEGWGEGLSRGADQFENLITRDVPSSSRANSGLPADQSLLPPAAGPHPNPLPGYRARGPKKALIANPRPWLIKHLRLLDPACGTMNFGLAAIDLLREMYREELTRAGEPGWPVTPSVACEAEIDNAILRHNLFGIELDPFVLQLAHATLELKLNRRLDPAALNLHCGDALFDTTIHRRWPGGFDVVVTNPPYLSARNVSPVLARRWKLHYPLGARDAYACFIERSLRLLRTGGRAGLLTMQSFMFTGSYEPLRQWIAGRAAIEQIAHFGPGLFDTGNPGTLQTVAFVLRDEADAEARDRQSIQALRLIDAPDKQHALLAMSEAEPHAPSSGDGRARTSNAADPAATASAGLDGVGAMRDVGAINLVIVPRDQPKCAAGVPTVCPSNTAAAPSAGDERVEFRLSQSDLLLAPRNAWIYWLTDRERTILTNFPKLREISPPRQGLATTDNLRFIRAWWEVEAFSSPPTCRASADRWTPYVKAGQNRRWYEAPRHRVNWENGGAEIKSTIVQKYPYLRGKWEWVAKNAAYYGRAGVTYSYLTSGRFSARRLEPGCIFDVAGSSLFPDDPLLTLAVLNSSVGRRLLAAINPTVNFQVGDLAELPMITAAPQSLRDGVSRLIELQKNCDRADETAPDFERPMDWAIADEAWSQSVAEVARLEESIDQDVAALYDLPTHAAPTPAATLDRVELARRWVSFALGNAMQSQDYAVIDGALAARVRESLEASAGGASARDIELALGGIEAFLRGPFATWHGRLMRSRPRWWLFGDRSAAVLIAHDRADRATLVTAMRMIRQSVPAKWNRVMDDGIAVNLSPLRDRLADRVLQRSLNDVADLAGRGSLAWSQTYGGAGRAQVNIELRMRSCSDASVARLTLPASSEQVNSAPTRNRLLVARQ